MCVEAACSAFYRT